MVKSQQSLVNSVNTAGTEMVHECSEEEALKLRERLDRLNVRWKALGTALADNREQ